MPVKRLILCLLLVTSAFAQVRINGGVSIGGGVSINTSASLPPPPTTFWNPTLTLNNLLYNNTSNCYPSGQNCAPEVGTTSNQSLFGGMQETRFPNVSATISGSTATLSVPVTSGASNGVYNFSSTDSVVVSGLSSPFNGTHSVNTVTSGSPGKLTFTVSGSGSGSGGTIYRSNQSAQDFYIPAPANVADCANDGVCIHDLIWLNYDGYVFIHDTPFQHCPSSGSCLYAAKPNQTTNGSHVMVGYESDNLNEVTAQYNYMLRLKKPSKKMGMVFDWGGGPVQGMSTTRTKEDAVMDLWSTVTAGNAANFVITVAHDNSGWNTQAVANACGDSSSTIVNNSDPDCVLRFFEQSLLYEHTATTSTYTSPLDGQTYNGGGYFANSAYLRDQATGRPINFSFINGESSFFGSCTSGSPCNVGGTNCTSSSDCWSKIKSQLATYISGWGTDAPLFLWRNSFTNNASINAGDMMWWNPTSNAATEPYDTSQISAAGVGGSQASKIFVPSAGAHLNHAQSSFQNDALIIGGRCGQTFLDYMSKIVSFGSGVYFGPGVKTPLGVQLMTWNDHEEGSALEPGIPICYSISASLSGNTVSWSLTTSDTTYAPLSPLNGTIDHVALLAVKTGGAVGSLDTQVIATANPASSGSFNLSAINMDSGAYTLYVRLVPKTLMQTKTTSGMSYTR